MEKGNRIRSEEILKIRKQKKHLSIVNSVYRSRNLLPESKNQVLPNLNPAFKPKERSSVGFAQHYPLQISLIKTSDQSVSKYTQILTIKLEEKLKTLTKPDDISILKAHLDIFQKIIKIDTFGSVLEKIRLNFLSYIEKHSKNADSPSKNQNFTHDEFCKIQETLKDFEISKKLVESKLKKLSIENIELQNTVDHLKEENTLLMSFQKNVKIVDGAADPLQIYKQLKTQQTVCDTLDKKNKYLAKKEKYLSALIRALKERGINPNELVGRHNIERMGSADSMSMSRLSFCSELGTS